MQPTVKVAILGAGALGAMYAEKLQQAAGFETSFVARGERARRLAEQGVVVNGNPLRVAVIEAGTATQPVDLVLVALKDQHLPQALPDLAGLVGPQTLIISVMNGLESEAAIAALYGWEPVIDCVAVGMDAVREANQIVYGNLGKLFVGETENTPPYSARLQRLISLLESAGLPYEVPQDMTHKLWWKVMVNVGMNQLTAVCGVPYGAVQTRKDLQALMEGLMEEVIALGQAEGVRMSRQDIADWYPVLNNLSPQGKTSMLQDIEAGRKTEVEVFGGKMIKLGEKHQIPTPFNQAFVTILRRMEESQNPG